MSDFRVNLNIENYFERSGENNFKFFSNPNSVKSGEVDKIVSVWYVRKEFFRDFCLAEGLEDSPLDMNDLDRTHSVVMKIYAEGWKDGDRDKVFEFLNIGSFNINGERNEELKRVSVGHSSMSSGDVLVVYDPNNSELVLNYCASVGWEKVKF